MIRMLHFADLHVGMENYGRIDQETGTSSRVRDFLDRLDQVIDYALENDADITVFAGDAFKTRDPDKTQQREFARRIKRLADKMPVLLLVGNHDLPAMAVKATTLDIFSALNVEGTILGKRPDSQVVQTKSGPVFLGWMPYPMRNRLLVREEYKGATVRELEDAMQERVRLILDDMTKKAATHDMPRILSGHFSIDSAKLGSERTVMLGNDVAVSLNDINDPTWDYVAMGHIHKHQDLNKGRYPSVVYSGSLERIDFGEEKEKKGFCWIELEREKTTWQFIEVEARAFKTIKVDVRGVDDPTEDVLDSIKRKNIEDAIVRVLIDVKAEQVPQLRDREIKTALKEAYSFSITQKVEHEARARLGEFSAESLTPEELVEKYFIDKQFEPERIEKLTALAEGIFKTDT